MVHAKILENAIKPWEEALGSVEASDVPKGIHEGVLRKVQSVLRLSDKSESHIIGWLHIILNDGGKSVAITLFAAFNDGPFVSEDHRRCAKTYTASPLGLFTASLTEFDAKLGTANFGTSHSAVRVKGWEVGDAQMTQNREEL